MIEKWLLEPNENLIKEANRRAHGNIDVLIMPQPEDYEIWKTACKAQLQEVVKNLIIELRLSGDGLYLVLTEETLNSLISESGYDHEIILVKGNK